MNCLVLLALLLLSSGQALRPSLNASGIVMREPLFAAAGRPREVALTFDADMTPGMEGELRSGKVRSFDNEAVVRVLEQTNTPATSLALPGIIAGLKAGGYRLVTVKTLLSRP